MFASLVRFVAMLLCYLLSGIRGWRCLWNIVVARDWPALGYYCDIVSLGPRSYRFITWLVSRFPPPPIDPNDPNPF